jgi:hypothetical protein
MALDWSSRAEATPGLVRFRFGPEISVHQDGPACFEHPQAEQLVIAAEEQVLVERPDRLDHFAPKDGVLIPARHVHGDISAQLVVGDMEQLPASPVPSKSRARDRSSTRVVTVPSDHQPQALDDVVAPRRIVVVVDHDPVVAELREPPHPEGDAAGGTQVVSRVPVRDPALAYVLGDAQRGVAISVVHDEDRVGWPRLPKQRLERVPKRLGSVPGDDEGTDARIAAAHGSVPAPARSRAFGTGSTVRPRRPRYASSTARAWSRVTSAP